MNPSEPTWLDPELYPFAPRRFQTSDGAMSYVDQGRGDPILFVHGTPSWSFEWRHALRALSRSRRTLAPDHLGFGLSEKPALAPYRPEDHARRLMSWFDALDLRRVTLVVHDFGGPIGLPLALERPDRIAKLVIMNTWMWSLAEDRAAMRASSLVRSPLGRFLYLGLNASPRFVLPASFADKKKLSREAHRHYVRPFSSRAERVAPYVLGCELAGSSDFYERLWSARGALAKLPSLLLWGEKDPAFGLAHLERWLAALPGAEVVRLPAGHFPQEECPDEVVARLTEPRSA